MNRIFIPYSKAQYLINEGDILLFRGYGFISYWIKWASKGEYSHVGMASRNGNIVECVEFREFKGGRTINLLNYLQEMSGRIDVYRVSSSALTYTLDNEYKVHKEVVRYNGRNVTNLMRGLTGLPYGWQRICLLAQHHLPIIRFFSSTKFEDKSENGSLYPVCSTAVAASIRKTYVDLMPNLSDFEMTPSDIGRSSLVHYLFTITK